MYTWLIQAKEYAPGTSISCNPPNSQSTARALPRTSFSDQQSSRRGPERRRSKTQSGKAAAAKVNAMGDTDFDFNSPSSNTASCHITKTMKNLKLSLLQQWTILQMILGEGAKL